MNNNIKKIETDEELKNIINSNIKSEKFKMNKMIGYKKIFTNLGFKFKKELLTEIKEENSNNVEWKVYFKLNKENISYLVKIRGTALTHYYNGKFKNKYGYQICSLEIFKTIK